MEKLIRSLINTVKQQKWKEKASGDNCTSNLVPTGQTIGEEMAIHSSILAWEIPWTEEPVRLHCPYGWKESDPTEAT